MEQQRRSQGAGGAGTACVSFRLGQETFGLPLDQLREIAAAGAVAPVPLAPPEVKGLANLRGRVVTLLDVARVFGRPLPPARCREDRLALVLAAPHDHLGLYVHGPVEIGRATAAEALARATAMAGGATGSTPLVAHPARAAGRAAQAGGPAVVSGEVIHLLSAPELIAHCDSKVLEGFRRRS
jgi:chemotaxis signal transduction protein